MSRRGAAAGRWIAFAVLVLVGAGGLRFGLWARDHVAALTRSGDGAGANCLDCHGPRARALPTRPRGRAYPSPIALAWAAGGERLLVSCEGTGEIVRIDPERKVVEARWSLGGMPHGIAVHPEHGTVFVALPRLGRVLALDPDAGTQIASAAVGRLPRGLAIDPGGKTLVVANSGSDDISLVDVETMAERCRLAAGREPYAVSIDAEGALAHVANRMANLSTHPDRPASEVTVVDLRAGRVRGRPRVDSAHMSEGIAALAGGGGRALFSLIRVRNLVPITQVAQGWVMTSALGLVLPGRADVLQFPLDEVNAYFGDPTGVAVDAEGGRAYVASGGMDCVSVVDLERVWALAAGVEGGAGGGGPWADHLGVSSDYVLTRIPVGANPRALLLSGDGRRLCVAERLGSSVAIIDTRGATLAARIELGSGEAPDRVRRGDRLFHNADVTFQGQFSCRSCHADGHVDGLAYDFAIDGMGKNILDNRSLLGLAGTAPFKWNGKNVDLFMQCGPRFARILTRSDPFPPEDLDRLVGYILSLLAAPVPERLSPLQARGRALFERALTNEGRPIPLPDRCPTCHAPPLYTNRRPSSVATTTATDSHQEFDTPHLIGIADSAPYLHDGRARTLEEIWTVHGGEDEHGVVNDMSKEQLNELVEFLKTL